MLQPGEKLFKPTFQGIFLKFRAAFDIGQKGHFFMKKGRQKFPPSPYLFNPVAKCFASK